MATESAEGAAGGDPPVATPLPVQSTKSSPKQKKEATRAPPKGCSKKTSVPLPNPNADRMRDLANEGYGHEPTGHRLHLQKSGPGNKNYDSLRVDEAGLMVADGEGLCRHELVNTGAGRALPTPGEEPPAETRPQKESHLSRVMTNREPHKDMPCLKIDKNEKMRQSNVLKMAEEGEKASSIVDPSGKGLSGKRAVHDKRPDSLGVGKEMPEEVHHKLLKPVETSMKTTLKCGEVEPEPFVAPPKPNSGPMASSLGSADGGLIPVRHVSAKLKKADDETPEGEPHTWDPKYKKQGLFSRQPAPFACGTQFGGGMRHKPGKKIEKKDIGVAPYAVGEMPMPNNAEEKMAKVKPCPFGTERNAAASATDSLMDEQKKQRIAKSLKKPDVCPFAIGESKVTGEVDQLDADRLKTRITKTQISKEVKVAPFASINDETRVDARHRAKSSFTPTKERQERHDAPFATGGIMMGNYKHQPKGAAGTAASTTGAASPAPAASPAEAPAPPPPPAAEAPPPPAAPAPPPPSESKAPPPPVVAPPAPAPVQAEVLGA